MYSRKRFLWGKNRQFSPVCKRSESYENSVSGHRHPSSRPYELLLAMAGIPPPIWIRFARGRPVLTTYYCSDAPCLPSRAALVSGMFGIRNGAVGHGGKAADRFSCRPSRDFTNLIDDQCFHQIFRHAGMHTASISTFAERHSSWWFNAGFNEVLQCGRPRR